MAAGFPQGAWSQRDNEPGRGYVSSMTQPWRSHLPFRQYSLCHTGEPCCVGGHEYQEGGSYGDTIRLTATPSYFCNHHLLNPLLLDNCIMSAVLLFCGSLKHFMLCKCLTCSWFHLVQPGFQSHLGAYPELGPLWTTPYKH